MGLMSYMYDIILIVQNCWPVIYTWLHSFSCKYIHVLQFSVWQFCHDISSVEEYERSWEQNEELGLNDIDTSSADVAYESTNTTKTE